MKAELEIEATTDDLEEVVRFVDAQLEQADGSMKRLNHKICGI